MKQTSKGMQRLAFRGNKVVEAKLVDRLSSMRREGRFKKKKKSSSHAY